MKGAAPAKGAAVTELPADDAPPPKKRSKLKWILIAVTLLVALGGGAWFIMRPAGAIAPAAKEASGAPAETSKGAAQKAPVFLNLEPFTVNLLEENGDHYLQIGIVYQMADEKAIETAKVYMPVVRNRILMLLSSKRPSELATPDGKNKLVSELIAGARESIPPGSPERGVVAAYFSSFVIQ